MKNQNSQLDIGILIEEYQKEVSNLIKDVIFQKAYSKQLEKEVEELKKKLNEQDVVEVSENK